MHALHYQTSPILPLPHGMFNRLGGCSPAPFDSLNLSYHTGDDGSLVRANRSRALETLGLQRLVSIKQVHGDGIRVIESANALEEEIKGYDALISTVPGTGILIQQADCQAVLLADSGNKVIAAVHCGWRGSVLNIIGSTVHHLTSQFKLNPASLKAVISPSLGPCCAEFIHYRTELPQWMHAFQVRSNYFDFWAVSHTQLLQAGLRPEHIDTVRICTQCNRQFFSYRRARQESDGITGRNGSIIGIPASQ